jgi:CRP-like cAMP-binding protein
VTALAWPRLHSIERAVAPPQRQLELLGTSPLFAPLAPPTLEALAQKLVLVAYAAGATVVREGDPGDRFYLVSVGQLAVSAGGRDKASLSPGDFFGEIALLRNVPRTATVTAVGEVELYALERDDFVSAVTGHPESAAAAAAVVARRLGSLRPGVASL